MAHILDYALLWISVCRGISAVGLVGSFRVSGLNPDLLSRLFAILELNVNGHVCKEKKTEISSL